MQYTLILVGDAFSADFYRMKGYDIIMQILLALSIALFGGLIMSRLTKKWNLPAVTAYLVAGILIGPFCLGQLGIEGLGFTSLENVESFKILSDVALGFIAITMGNEFANEIGYLDWQFKIEEIPDPPKTGDEANLMLYGTVALVSLVALVAVLVVYKRKKTA
jgi:hypothetical protein